jgi:hypothetical protein
LPSISWSTSQSCCFQIHIQYSFGNFIFFYSLYMPLLTENFYGFFQSFQTDAESLLAVTCSLRLIHTHHAVPMPLPSHAVSLKV